MVLEAKFRPRYWQIWSFPFLFCFLEPHLQHREVLRLGVELALQLPAYTTAAATLWVLSCSTTYTTAHGLAPSKARGWTYTLLDTGGASYCWATMGTSRFGFWWGPSSQIATGSLFTVASGDGEMKSLPPFIRALIPVGTPSSWPHLNLIISQRSHFLIPHCKGGGGGVQQLRVSAYEFGGGGHTHIVFDIGWYLKLTNNIQGGQFACKKLFKILNLLIFLLKQNPIFYVCFIIDMAVSHHIPVLFESYSSKAQGN